MCVYRVEPEHTSPLAGRNNCIPQLPCRQLAVPDYTFRTEKDSLVDPSGKLRQLMHIGHNTEMLRDTCPIPHRSNIIRITCPVYVSMYYTISQHKHVMSISTASTECSYNYISKVLFITPSWYLFTIEFGHIYTYWWVVPPLCIQIQKNTTHAMHAVIERMVIRKGAITLHGQCSKRIGPTTRLMKHVHNTLPRRVQFWWRQHPCSFAMTKDVLFSSSSSA